MIFSYLPRKANENYQTILPSVWAIIGGLLLRAVFPKVKPKLQPEGEKRKGFFCVCHPVKHDCQSNFQLTNFLPACQKFGTGMLFVYHRFDG
ncbi:hypothetical protein FBQ85_18720 [Cytophagia bacterium CHB2]|nr:hypothetical protein [Cytophagia bacterium CHB2]